MKPSAKLACIAATAFLGACTSTPSAHHITLDDGQPPTARSSVTPAVAVIRANVPDLIDRPQLVLRSDGNQVALSDEYRWAEPLRREIPRLLARDIGELLNSNRVVALPANVESLAADFKLALDFQQFDAVVGKGVDVDVLWRIEPRGDKAFVGRSSFRQLLKGPDADQLALVAAQRQALRRVAAEIALDIHVYRKP